MAEAISSAKIGLFALCFFYPDWLIWFNALAMIYKSEYCWEPN